MSKRQKIALVSGLSLGLLLIIVLLLLGFRWTSTLLESMRSDIRVTGLVVALFSLIIAISALIIAWNNFRRGNTPVVKLIDIQTIGTNSAKTGGKIDLEFSVFIKNLGIPLHTAQVGLNAMTKAGTMSIPFEQFDISGNVLPFGTLEKGMVGIFSLKESRLKPEQKQMVQILTHEATDISIGVFSSSFRVKRFRIPDKFPNFKKTWNAIARKLNDQFTTAKSRWGKTFTRTRKPFHTFPDFEFQLQVFVGGIGPRPPATPVAQVDSAKS